MTRILVSVTGGSSSECALFYNVRVCLTGGSNLPCESCKPRARFLHNIVLTLVMF
jgi:hypothetical protein